MIISIEPAETDVLNQLRYMPDVLKKVAGRAVRQSINAGKSTAKSGAKKRYTLSSKILSRSMKSRVSGTRGVIKISGGRNLIGEGIVKNTAHGIFAIIVRGQGGEINRAFQKKYQGGWWRRVGKPRFPIKRLKTVSAPGMASHPTVSTPTINKMAEILNREILAGMAAL